VDDDDPKKDLDAYVHPTDTNRRLLELMDKASMDRGTGRGKLVTKAKEVSTVKVKLRKDVYLEESLFFLFAHPI
jgi:hypothetical protein